MTEFAITTQQVKNADYSCRAVPITRKIISKHIRATEKGLLGIRCVIRITISVVRVSSQNLTFVGVILWVFRWSLRKKGVPMTMIERSPVFLEMLRHIEKMTRCDIPVLIEGETGAGKELVARANL
ncbi:sigma 54-interacting transcriptional regulator [Nitrosomonas sp. Nm58]|jgi:transcriptional regulator with PAS, ATPase and Fis domain|uniref:sigma 54-interacting transcriptional regulator n=1 Tax=Nitrosomonas sp. Nm58 TaxID=200126 RepID=UPI00089D3AC8|nr:sigma 54-interacting transcriptional regulator [Nitrosomonas sp. Nm58]SDZ09307.1 Sigma-54 interaction domain-containing protein [Nitrosomonas sp. Nm58]